MHASTILVREMVSRVIRVLAPLLVVAGLPACDKVPLTAPTESTILLFANGSSVPLTGGVDLVATVTEKPGTPVQNGTLVTFTTTLGRVDPPEARTTNGRATVRLFADGRSGTAKVTALSGGAAKAELEIPIGAGAADNLVLRAEPTAVGASGGTVQLIATVRDATGNAIPGVPVTFSTTAGQISPATVTSDANGEARTSLTTTRASTVTASAGSKTATVEVTYTGAPTIAIAVTPESPTTGEVVTFAITVTPATDVPIQSIEIDFGDGRRTNLGSSSTSASHVYATAGTFTVRVIARDVTGQETEQATVIAVSALVGVSIDTDLAPGENATIGVPVQFTALVSGAGTVLQYRWNFGDGSEQTTTIPTVMHTYTETGTKVISVSVLTSTGGTGTAQTQVTVNP
jgi:PKD repeat protein